MLNPLPHAAQHTLAVLPRIISHMKEGGQLLLALDFDGTLAPICAHPMEAKVPPSTLSSLVALSRCSGVQVLIISGRSRATLSTLLGPAITNFAIASSHGFSIYSSRWGKKEIAEDSLPALAVANSALRA